MESTYIFSTDYEMSEEEKNPLKIFVKSLEIIQVD